MFYPLDLFARMFLGIILHLAMVEEIEAAAVRMKFAINHPYKFHSPSVAAGIAFC